MNILNEQGAQPNDALFFHYSGHGGRAKDLDGDEEDGFDETIYPLDHERAGIILDDTMHDIMVRRLPPGCRLTAIFDSCHSGTALDLPYVYSTEGKLKEPNMLADVGQGALGAVMDYARGDIGGMLSSLTGAAKRVMNANSGAAERNRTNKYSPADVIQWSGCKDTQTSADATENGTATGAMSYAFITALSRYPQQSYMQLLNTVRDELAGKCKFDIYQISFLSPFISLTSNIPPLRFTDSQKPQLSCSHELDCNLKFVM